MQKLRGAVGVFGLLALAVSIVISERHVMAQRGEDPSLQLLEDRSKDARERIVALESTGATLAIRLTRIETELEISRRVGEANGQKTTGLVVGIGLILVERAFVLISYLARRHERNDHG